LGRGDMVAFIDSDDIWDREKTSNPKPLVMDALPKSGIVCSDFSALRGSRILETSHITIITFLYLTIMPLTYDDVFSRPARLARRGARQRRCGLLGQYLLLQCCSVTIILTSTCLCRAVVFNTTGCSTLLSKLWRIMIFS